MTAPPSTPGRRTREPCATARKRPDRPLWWADGKQWRHARPLTSKRDDLLTSVRIPAVERGSNDSALRTAVSRLRLVRSGADGRASDHYRLAAKQGRDAGRPD